MKNLLALLLVFTLIYSCKSGKDEPQAGPDSTAVDVSELGNRTDSVTAPVVVDSVQLAMDKDSILMSLTKEVFTIFKNREYAKLDSLIHPQEGIRFSPYATIDAGDDKKFSREAYNQLISANKNKKLKWGSYDGSGDPILLTPAEYFRKFVYDGNFVNPDKKGVNKMLGSGNSINNLKAAYPGSNYTESYLSGTKKNGGLDWRSVRLVFKEEGGKYYLVGIVHDQWTI